MSDVRDPETDQQLPVPNDHPSMHDLAVDLMYSRKAHGLRKYGSLLQPANGRSFSQDAVEEAADLLVYMLGKQWEEEHPQETWLGRLIWALLTDGPLDLKEIPRPVIDMLVSMQADVDAAQRQRDQ